ncbi:hypothetical protein AB834_05950 [PVC group bacterium (ex Bugula neritina AB1)]|nr:hypothetical protein AB834_05950 [PVC group bacterium (ex Bugula neritina AB1)]
MNIKFCIIFYIINFIFLQKIDLLALAPETFFSEKQEVSDFHKKIEDFSENARRATVENEGDQTKQILDSKKIDGRLSRSFIVRVLRVAFVLIIASIFVYGCISYPRLSFIFLLVMPFVVNTYFVFEEIFLRGNDKLDTNKVLNISPLKEKVMSEGSSAPFVLNEESFKGENLDRTNESLNRVAEGRISNFSTEDVSLDNDFLEEKPDRKDENAIAELESLYSETSLDARDTDSGFFEGIEDRESSKEEEDVYNVSLVKKEESFSGEKIERIKVSEKTLSNKKGVVSFFTEEELKSCMQKIVTKHHENHDLECAYDSISHFLYLNGIKNLKGEPLSIEDLRFFFKEIYSDKFFYALKLNEKNISTFFLSKKDRFAEEKRKNLWKRYASLESEDEWDIFLLEMENRIQEKGLAMMHFSDGVYNIYGVDWDTKELLVVDPHAKDSGVLSRWPLGSIPRDRSISIFSYPSKGDEVLNEIDSFFKENGHKVNLSLLNEDKWKKLFYQVSDIHTQLYKTPLSLNARDDTYVSLVDKGFYDEFQKHINANIERYNGFVKNLSEFVKGNVSKETSEKILTDDLKSLPVFANYLLYLFPKNYYNMIGHYSWHVVGKNFKTSFSGGEEDTLSEERAMSIVTSLIDKYSNTYNGKELQSLKSQIEFSKIIRTPAQYQNGKVLLNLYFWKEHMSEKENLFLLSVLIHEYIRTVNVDKLEMWTSSTGIEKSSRLVENEKKLILEELNFLKNVLGEKKIKELSEHMKQLYDTEILADTPEATNWANILDEFIEEYKDDVSVQNISSSLDNMITEYLKKAMAA